MEAIFPDTHMIRNKYINLVGSQSSSEGFVKALLTHQHLEQQYNWRKAVKLECETLTPRFQEKVNTCKLSPAKALNLTHRVHAGVHAIMPAYGNVSLEPSASAAIDDGHARPRAALDGVREGASPELTR